MAELRVEKTPIEGLLVVHLPVHGDNRGWFKENWQREKMTALGLPDFRPVQQNVSFNASRGATRGIHAEPWDKLVSLASGRMMGAWVDLREGEGFGTTVTVEMGPETAVFVPRGVGNSYQALEDGTAYCYLVNDHWSAKAREKYTYVNLFDPALGIDWPIARGAAEISAADEGHPLLAQVTPMPRKRTVVTGAGGQLARALAKELPDALMLTSEHLDITDPTAVADHDWSNVDTIINAAAYTAVDLAETPQGRRDAWAVNVSGVANLAAAAREHRLTLVHVSSDYVFDGVETEHTEDEPFSPLGVYGQTKAAGDLLAASVAQHYIVRTSWVIGEGDNFVTTMASLADKGVSPSVVADQYGRLTFTEDLAAGVVHLLRSGAEYGTYNLTNSGPVHSWAEIAARVFELRGRPAKDVTPVTTAAYSGGKQVAPRPVHSTLNLTKIAATGFEPPSAARRLEEHVRAMS